MVGRHLLHVSPLLPRTGRLHQSQRPISLGTVDRLRRDVRRHAGGRRFHPDRGGRDLQHQALSFHRPAHDSDGIPGLSAGVRRADVRPRTAVEHLASADHAQSALGDVRGRLLRHVLHHGAGPGVLADRAGALQPAEAVADCPQRDGGLRDPGRAALDAAPVVAGHAVPHHAQQAASLLVQPAVAGVLLPVGDCGGLGDDHLRVFDEFEVLRPRAGAADPVRPGTRAGGRACALRHPEVRGPVPPRRPEPGLRLQLRAALLPAGDLPVGDCAARSSAGAEDSRERARPVSGGGADAAGLRDQSSERHHHRSRERGRRPLHPEVDGSGDYRHVRRARLRHLRLVAKYLPIFPEEKAHIPALREPEACRRSRGACHMLETDNSNGSSTHSRTPLCSIRAGSNGWDAASAPS